jgi:hypothetical protein
VRIVTESRDEEDVSGVRSGIFRIWEIKGYEYE